MTALEVFVLHMADLLCCTAENNTLLSNYNIFFFFLS